jgi:hypothetical protein
VSRARRPRLAYGPLLAAAGCGDAVLLKPRRVHLDPQGIIERPVHQHAPQRTLAELVGVSVWTVGRWSTRGIPIDDAEDAACALGDHPARVWGDVWAFAAACPLAKTMGRERLVIGD